MKRIFFLTVIYITVHFYETGPRSYQHPATKTSPHDLMTGRPMRMKFDVHKLNVEEKDTDIQGNVRNYQKKMKQSYDRQNAYKFRKIKTSTGDKVRVKRPRKAKNVTSMSSWKTVKEEICMKFVFRPVFFVSMMVRNGTSIDFTVFQNDNDEEVEIDPLGSNQDEGFELPEMTPQRTRRVPEFFALDRLYH